MNRATHSRIRQLIELLVHPPRWFRLFALLLGSIAVALLFYLGSKPFGGGLFTHPYDKLAHFLVYGGLASLVWVALGSRTKSADLFAIVLAVLIGTADEAMQRTIPTRQASLGDLVFDVLGAVIAVGLLCWLRSRIDPANSDRQSGPEPDPSI